MYDEVIKLVSEKKDTDKYGDSVVVRSERKIFAELKSVGQSEFYQAQANGFKPEIKFVIADYLDYGNEKKVLYQAFNEAEEHEYRVIRTYRNGNQLEITCERGVEE